MRARSPLLAVAAAVLGAAALGLVLAPPVGPAVPAGALAPPAAPRAPARFVFVAGGDIALAGGADARTLAGIARFVRRADLAVGNLEGTLATGGSPRCGGGRAAGCFTFRGSPAWARVLRRTGFTDLNVANNHALDYGLEGQRETISALQRAGLAFDGLPGQVTYLRVKGVRVALVGFAPYRWAQQLLDVPAATAIVRRAARHADVVIGYMHAGAEGAGEGHVTGREEHYLGERRGNPLAFAHALVDAGADLVFASGPHVVRGLQWYRGRLIAYSLGNLAGVHTLATAGALGESALLHVTLDDDGGFVAGSLVPIRLDASGRPAYDTTRKAVSRMRALSRRDFGASAMTVSRSGKLFPPLQRRALGTT